MNTISSGVESSKCENGKCDKYNKLSGEMLNHELYINAELLIFFFPIEIYSKRWSTSIWYFDIDYGI